jgi:hypothetical protein
LFDEPSERKRGFNHVPRNESIFAMTTSLPTYLAGNVNAGQRPG